MPYNFNINVSMVYPDGWETLDPATVSSNEDLEVPYVQAQILNADGTPSEDPDLISATEIPFTDRLQIDENGEQVISVDTSKMELFSSEVENSVRVVCEKYIMMQHEANFPEEYEQPAEEEAPAE